MLLDGLVKRAGGAGQLALGAEGIDLVRRGLARLEAHYDLAREAEAHYGLAAARLHARQTAETALARPAGPRKPAPPRPGEGPGAAGEVRVGAAGEVRVRMRDADARQPQPQPQPEQEEEAQEQQEEAEAEAAEDAHVGLRLAARKGASN